MALPDSVRARQRPDVVGERGQPWIRGYGATLASQNVRATAYALAKPELPGGQQSDHLCLGSLETIRCRSIYARAIGRRETLRCLDRAGRSAPRVRGSDDQVSHAQRVLRECGYGPYRSLCPVRSCLRPVGGHPGQAQLRLLLGTAMQEPPQGIHSGVTGRSIAARVSTLP
jgi:hypothetical protein